MRSDTSFSEQSSILWAVLNYPTAWPGLEVCCSCFGQRVNFYFLPRKRKNLEKYSPVNVGARRSIAVFPKRRGASGVLGTWGAFMWRKKASTILFSSLFLALPDRRDAEWISTTIVVTDLACWNSFT